MRWCTRGRRCADHIVFDGFPQRPEYLRQLARGSVVISTAMQENFGIAVMEAIHAGCMPLLPRRLVYPELIPPEHHDRCLYDGPDDWSSGSRGSCSLRGPSATGGGGSPRATRGRG